MHLGFLLIMNKNKILFLRFYMILIMFIAPTTAKSRPGKIVFPQCKIPTFDLGGKYYGAHQTDLIHPIIEASRESGFFQVINHGISEKLMDDVLKAADEFFQLPLEDKASFYSEDFTKSCRIDTSVVYSEEKIHYWRNVLQHDGHSLGERMQLWPSKPTQYREVMGKYSEVVKELSLWILKIVFEGLGVGLEYMEEEMRPVQLISNNNYPACPDPSLTLGLPKHCDVTLITVLMQGGVNGLQVFEDGQWFAVDPLPGALLVFVGQALQVISNGELKSVEHRAVTSQSVGRTSVVSSIHPSKDSLIEPAKAIVDKCGRPLYRAFLYKDFVASTKDALLEGRSPLVPYELQLQS